MLDSARGSEAGTALGATLPDGRGAASRSTNVHPFRDERGDRGGPRTRTACAADSPRTLRAAARPSRDGWPVVRPRPARRSGRTGTSSRSSRAPRRSTRTRLGARRSRRRPTSSRTSSGSRSTPDRRRRARGPRRRARGRKGRDDREILGGDATPALAGPAGPARRGDLDPRRGGAAACDGRLVTDDPPAGPADADGIGDVWLAWRATFDFDPAIRTTTSGAGSRRARARPRPGSPWTARPGRRR